jgi:hypothetical protein
MGRLAGTPRQNLACQPFDVQPRQDQKSSIGEDPVQVPSVSGGWHEPALSHYNTP